MTIGFIVWDNSWKGSAFSLNLFKCSLASIGFLILSFATRPGGDFFPADVFTKTSVGYLMLSATIGILIGDWIWLEGLRLLGARRVIVIDSCKPFLAALFGWAILGEALEPPAFGGMALTVLGVLIVSLEGEKEAEDDQNDESKNEEKGVEEIQKDEGTQGEGALGAVDSPLANEGCGEAPDEDATESLEPSDDMVDSIESDTDIGGKNDVVDSIESDTNIGGGENSESTNAKHNRRILSPAQSRRGYAMAFLNVVLDTYGSLLTKEHGVGMTTWEINLIRFGFSAACMLVLSIVLHARQWVIIRGHQRQETDIEQDEGEKAKESPSEAWYSLPRTMTRKAWVKVSAGVGLVTFLTPALSNYALFQIALALALTLGSVGPLYALPLTWLMQHDRPTLRACVGGILAVAGIIVLSLWGKQQ